MIKKIAVKYLQPDMYITDLNCDWIPHHNLQKEGRIPDSHVIDRIKELGIKEVYIDSSKGMDSQDSIPAREADAKNEQDLHKVSLLIPDNDAKVTVAEEFHKAERLHNKARGMIENVLNDVKTGKSFEIAAFEEIADGMVDSVLRNHNALACLGRIREKDTYLMEHSINLAVLMGIFSKAVNIPRDNITKSVTGALLHDIGKVMIPDEILHKPGKLTAKEFEIIKEHVSLSRDILQTVEGIDPLTVKVAAEHHERVDGSGYPLGLTSCQLCTESKMVAITDVYDAITADRVYHKGMPPTNALKKLLEWSGSHLDESLVHRFIKTVGIYPVGSLVKLDSGRLAIVLEPGEKDLKAPIVKIFYNSKTHDYLPVQILDLSKPSVQDFVVSAADPIEFKININDFIGY